MKRSLVVFGLGALLLSCTQPRTQVMAEITADLDIQGDLDRLRIRLTGAADQTALEEAEFQEQILVPLSWPVRVPIIPLNNDGTRVYRLEVTALGGAGATIVNAVAISGFVQGETRLLEIHLGTACRTAPTCMSNQTCRLGICRPAFVSPTSLPVYEIPDAGPPIDGQVGDAANVCGDRRRAGAEQCDDGNRTPGDGCDANCMLEVGCGNTVVESPEQCDEGGPTVTCTDTCMLRQPVCGDDFFLRGEICYPMPAPTTQIPEAMGFSWNVVDAGDFNADGAMDLALGGSGAFRILGGDGDGAFPMPGVALGNTISFIGTMEIMPPTGTRAAVVTRPDISCGSSCVSRRYVPGAFDGAISLLDSYSLTNPVGAMALGDANGDNLTDIAVAFTSPLALGGVALIVNVGTSMRVGPETILDIAEPSPPRAMALAPVSSFGSPLLWVFTNSSQIRAYTINGDSVSPSAIFSMNIAAMSGRPVNLTPVDLNSDGRAENVAVTYTDSTNVVTTFLPMVTPSPVPWNLIGSVAGAHLRDLNGDGMPHEGVIVADNSYAIVRVDVTQPMPLPELIHTGLLPPAPCVTRGSTVADFNGDAAPDIAIATSCGAYIVFATP